MKKISFILLSFLSCTIQAQQINYVQYVDPMIGTGGHGHTFPGATVPFGMVQLSPDTRIDGSWDGCSGYHQNDSLIYGFSHTHLSGTGCSDYGDIMLMPMMGIPEFEPLKYASAYSHKTEKAAAGYYAVKLEDDNIDVELTATTRVGFHKYTFNKDGKANFIIDLNHRDKLLYGKVRVLNDTTLEVYRESRAWAQDQHVYARIVFSKPIKKEASTSQGGKMILDAKEVYADGTVVKIAFARDVKKGESILVKVALSTTGYEGAAKNMDAELKGWNFEKVKANAASAWNKELSKIEVQTSDKEKLKIFYTALYHTMIQPNVSMDVDGMYRGRDNKVHKAEGFTYYSVFSLWDTFRAAHPLYTIIDKKRTLDFIKTFLAQYNEGGRLPVWELASNETDCMIGYHSVSVIADAAVKGIRDFDMKLALEAMKKSATWNHLGLPAYMDHGCLTVDDEHENVSKTLEYAYDDWCIAQTARLLSAQSDYDTYMKRSSYWRNVFDPEMGFMRPKKNGCWLSPFEPREVNNNFTEGNSWQYTFFVPQDIDGLIRAMNGADAFEKKLDALFTAPQQTTGRDQADITGLIGQYAHGNEPSHHMAYLYNYVNRSYKTQEKIHQILTDFYKATPDGLIGNEDCGQMSAWYVLSSLGIYQVCPGNPQFVFGSPVFNSAKVHLENGKTFTMEAKNISATNFYVSGISVDGKKSHENYLSYADIQNGAKLEFEMAGGPPAIVDLAPIPLQVNQLVVVPSPVISAPGRSFKGSMDVTIIAVEKDAKIYYTLDDSKPTKNSLLYTSALHLANTTTVKAIAVNSKGEESFVTSGTFYRAPHPDWKVKITGKYNPQYTAGGDEGLIDGMHGSENWRKGDWQGYQYQDFECVIDLGKETVITGFTATCLQDTRAWIVFPTKVEYSFSLDGVNFSEPLVAENTIPAKDYKVQIQNFEKRILASKSAKYIKVKATNFGKLPSWHEGFGDSAFIFIDEIEVK